MNTGYDTTCNLQDPIFLQSPRLVCNDSAKRSQDEMIQHDLDSLRIRTQPSPKEILRSSKNDPPFFFSPSKRPRPTRPLPTMFVPLQRPSKLQKEDKMLFVPNKGLSAVRFPSLPDFVPGASTRSTGTRDLSQIPCPKNIRLMPRRQTHRY